GRLGDRALGDRGSLGRRLRQGLDRGRRLLGRRLRGGGRLLGRLLLRRSRRRLGERLLQLADDGSLDGRRRRPDELPEIAQLGKDDLALYSELLRELVYPDLCHCSPSRPGRCARAGYVLYVLIAAGCSSSAHERHVVSPSSLDS